jgi:hypothetical protein
LLRGGERRTTAPLRYAHPVAKQVLERLRQSSPDFVRVPPGTRHGYANLSGAPVDLLVSFHPGGFEELFVRHRSDQDPPPPPMGFVKDAVEFFDSAFEDHPTAR